MADEIIGSLGVEVEGEISSSFQQSVDQAVAQSEQAANAIVAAFDVPDAGAGLAQAFTQVGDSASSASGQLDLFGQAAAESSAQLELFEGFTPSLSEGIGGVGDAAGSAVSPVESFGNAAGQAGEQAHEAEGGIAGMAEQFAALAEALVVTEGLKEFGEEALKAFGTVQSVTIGLTQLTGSAEKANEIIEQVEALAAKEPFAFPEIAPTVQKMVAMGISAEQVDSAMHAVADTAAATGNNFAAVAQKFDMITLSGNTSARSLTALGLNLTQLGAAMGVTADQAAATFKSISDQSVRVQILEDALGKFAGGAEAQAQGISGQWQIFENQFEKVMVGVGEAIAPVVGDILDFGKSVLGTVQEAEAAFEKLPEPVKDVAVALALVVAAVAPLAAGMSALGFAIIGFNTAWATAGSILDKFSISAGESAVAEEALAVATAEATVAAEAQTAATGELAVAQRGLGAGAGVASIAMAGLAVVVGSVMGWELGKWFVEATESAKPFETQALSIGGTLNELNQGVGMTADQLADLDAALATVDWSKFSDGAKEASGAVTDVTNKLGILTAGFTAVVKVQMDANAAIGQARVAYELAKDALANAVPGTQTYATALQVVTRAQIDLDAAITKATPHGKDWADTIGGISEAMGKAQEKFQSLSTIFSQLSQAAANGAQNNAALAEVYTKLASAATASGNTFASYQGILAQVQVATDQNYASFLQLGAAYGKLLTLQQSGVDVSAQLLDVYQKWQAAAQKVGESISTAAGEMAKLVQAAQGQQTAIEGVAGAFQKLASISTPTLAQQEALQTAFKTLTTDAQAMGIEVNVAGNSIAFSAKAGTEASAPLQAYIDKLNTIFSSSGNLVGVNGKLQLSAEALTAVNKLLADSTQKAGQAASDATGVVKVHSDTLDANAAAAQRARQAQIDLGSTYQTVQALEVVLTNAGKTQVTGIEDAVRAFVDLNSTTQTTVAGQIALQNAFKNAQSAGAALGITITATGATASGNATPAIQALVKQLNDAIQAMAAGSSAGNQFSGVLNNIASSASNAAGALSGVAKEVDAALSAMGNGGQGGGGTFNVLPGSSVHEGEPSAAGTPFGSQDGIVPIPPDPSPGTDYFDYITGTWRSIPSAYQAINKTTAASGVPQQGYSPASSSGSSSSSGVTALDTAAGQTATAVSRMGTAASGTATPLGAFVTSLTTLTDTTKQASSALQQGMTVQLEGDDAIKAIYAGLAQAGNSLTSAFNVVDTGAKSAGQELYTLTYFSAGQVETATNTATALAALSAALADATAGIESDGGATDAVNTFADAMAKTNNVAADYYTVQEKAAASLGNLDTKTQTYDQALADSINAENAYGNALTEMRNGANISADALDSLHQAAIAAAAAINQISGISGQGDSSQGTPLNIAHLVPDVDMPLTPPAGTSSTDASTGSWEWSPPDDKWIWNPNAKGISGATGFGTGNFPNAANPNMPQPPPVYTPQPLANPVGSPARSGVTIQVNLTTGPIVGTNAASIMTDAIAPQLVAKLRAGGMKL